MEEALAKLWHIIIVIIGAAIAFARLEGRVNGLQGQIDRMAAQRVEDRNMDREDRAEIKAMLKDLATDIKELRKDVGK